MPRGPYETTPALSSKWNEFFSKHGQSDEKSVREGGFIPTFYRAVPRLDIEHDTYVDTQGWGKGYLMVLYDNNDEIGPDMNLGR